MRSVYENVELVRKAKNLTKTAVSKKLKLTLQGYRHIANGSVELGAERLRTIAEFLDVKPAIFFDDKLTEIVITKAESKETKGEKE